MEGIRVSTQIKTEGCSVGIYLITSGKGKRGRNDQNNLLQSCSWKYRIEYRKEEEE